MYLKITARTLKFPLIDFFQKTSNHHQNIVIDDIEKRKNYVENTVIAS